MAAVADTTEPVDGPALDPAAHDPTAHDPTALDPAADLVSRRRARRWWWALGALALAAVLTLMWVAQRSEREAPVAPKAFCKAVKAFEDELTRTEERYDRSIDRQLPLVRDMAETAPRAIRADAQVFLTQLEAIAAAPNRKAREALQDDPRVEEAVDNVNRYATQGCGFFDRQGGL